MPGSGKRDDFSYGREVAGRVWLPDHESESAAEIIAAVSGPLTEAQSHGTKVASTVARDWKTEGISRVLH